MKAETETIESLREEIEVLRALGNKDCTAMADDALRERRCARWWRRGWMRYFGGLHSQGADVRRRGTYWRRARLASERCDTAGLRD